jgi:hypothetical protein
VTAGTLTDAPSLLESVGAGGTLDELIVALWQKLGTDRRVECPLCGEDMRPAYGAHARAIGGTCTGCGSTVH